MPDSLKDLEARALALSEQDRAELAARLLRSLAAPDEIDPSSGEEIDRRVGEIEAGRVDVAPVSSAITRVRESLR